jgi:hypothetical protein
MLCSWRFHLRSKFLNALLFLTWISLIYGCSTPAVDQTVSPAHITPTILNPPSPTAPPPIVERKHTPPPTSTLTPLPATATESPGSKEISVTTPDLTSKIVLDPIQIRSPGDGSFVVSPIPVEIVLTTNLPVKRMRLELIDEVGKLRARQVIDLSDEPPPGDLFTIQLEFEIPGDSQSGLLVVSLDDEPLQPLAVNSTGITLKTDGAPEIPLPEWQPKAIDIQQPVDNQTISGGVLTISGLTSLDPALPLKIQIIAQNGGIVGQRLVLPSGSSGDAFKPFATEIQYQITQETPARLIVFQDAEPGGTVTHLASLPIILTP